MEHLGIIIPKEESFLLRDKWGIFMKNLTRLLCVIISMVPLGIAYPMGRDSHVEKWGTWTFDRIEETFDLAEACYNGDICKCGGALCGVAVCCMKPITMPLQSCYNCISFPVKNLTSFIWNELDASEFKEKEL